MSISLITEKNVSLYEYPKDGHRLPLGADHEITEGDLHGNTLRLIRTLLKYRIIDKSSLNEAVYKEFASNYMLYSTDLDKEDQRGIMLDPLDEVKYLRALKKTISNISFNKKYKGLFRLIGDEFCDRGLCDLFTFLVFEKMFDNDIDYEILGSNHGFELIEAIETKTFCSKVLQKQHSYSLVALKRLIDKGILKPAEVERLYFKVYIPKAKLLSYTLSSDGGEINIFTHAPAGFKNIKNLADRLGVTFNDDTAVNLAKTIDLINKKYQEYLCRGDALTLSPFEQRENAYTGQEIPDDAEHAVTFLFWNRKFDNLDREHIHKGYKVNFIHGHDGTEPTRGNIYNIDNDVGKDYSNTRDEYTSVVTDHTNHDLLLDGDPDDEKLRSAKASQTPATSQKPTPYSTLFSVGLTLYGKSQVIPWSSPWPSATGTASNYKLFGTAAAMKPVQGNKSSEDKPAEVPQAVSPTKS